jgi:DNA-binding XRE family transcriptional regulator
LGYCHGADIRKSETAHQISVSRQTLIHHCLI